MIPELASIEQLSGLLAIEHVYLRALLLLGISVVIAILADLILSRVLGRLATKTKTQLDDLLLSHVRKPLFISVVMIGIALALDAIGAKPFYRFLIQGLLLTVAVFIWGIALNRLSARMLDDLSREDSGIVQPATLPIFQIASKIGLFGLATYFVLVAWDVNVTGWLASAGVVGIALGFAAKDTVANLLAGIFILADRPYSVGDVLVLGDGLRGKVTQIGIRSTRIVTPADVEVIVPNSLIATSQIVNESGGPRAKSRVEVAVGVAYGSDIAQVKAVLIGVVKGETQIRSSPEPWVQFHQFADSSLNFRLFVWIKDPLQRERVIDSLNTKIYAALAEAGIEIPFPQRDIHLPGQPPA
jgi:small-conductance mechanosensitive channel